MLQPALTTTASIIFAYISVGAQLIWLKERAVATLTQLIHHLKSDLQKIQRRQSSRVH